MTLPIRLQIVSFLESLIRSVTPSPGHRDLLLLHLTDSRDELLSDENFGPIDVPVLLHEALAPGRPAPVAVAAACTLVYLGADLLDNVADHELSPRWREAGADAATLAAATYLSSLTYLAIQRHAGAMSERDALTSALAACLSAMSAGQYRDLGNHALDAEQSTRVTELKAGSEFAFFMQAGAISAGATTAISDGFAEIGLAFGTATQLGSDIYDIFRKDPSPDLLNGRVTLPVIHATAVLEGDEREELLSTLSACREDGSRHEHARTLLRRAGGLRYAALIVEVYIQRAMRLTRALGLSQRATSLLLDYEGSISLLHTDREPARASR